MPQDREWRAVDKVVVRQALWVGRLSREPGVPTHKISLCAGCVRIVNLQGEPTAALAPELTFDFTIETVGE